MAILTDREIELAEERGRAAMASDPRAVSVRYDASIGHIALELSDGRTFGFPARLIQDLQGVSDHNLAEVQIDSVGFNLHWPLLDVDLHVPSLVAGIFGTKAWMNRELARVAGSARSEAKTLAARRNGSKGGRPKKAASI